MNRIDLSIVVEMFEVAWKMSATRTRISHGNIGKGKSSYFGSDKFLATSKYEYV